jgi:hypothetical protein
LPVQDAVARNAKFGMLYKRPGHRVLINDRGDLLVRPAFMDISVLNKPFGSSVIQVGSCAMVSQTCWPLLAPNRFQNATGSNSMTGHRLCMDISG